MNALGHKIASKRKDLGITQIEFAEKLNVTRQTVSRWEAGSVFPDIDKIPDIAALLNVSCDYLLRDDVTLESEPPVQGRISRLLKNAEGKKVMITFFDDDADPDLYNTPVTISGFEGSWMKASAETKKGRIEKLIPLSAVLSLEILQEEK